MFINKTQPQKFILNSKYQTHQVDENLPAVIEDLRVKMS